MGEGRWRAGGIPMGWDPGQPEAQVRAPALAISSMWPFPFPPKRQVAALARRMATILVIEI